MPIVSDLNVLPRLEEFAEDVSPVVLTGWRELREECLRNVGAQSTCIHTNRLIADCVETRPIRPPNKKRFLSRLPAMQIRANKAG